MTTPSSPRHRRFRFSLRTLFVLVLALSVPLAWLSVQLKWIHDRHQALEHHDALIVFWAAGNSDPEAPWSIRIFGEKGRTAITLRDDKSEAERTRLKKLFPESIVTP